MNSREDSSTSNSIEDSSTSSSIEDSSSISSLEDPFDLRDYIKGPIYQLVTTRETLSQLGQLIICHYKDKYFTHLSNNEQEFLFGVANILCELTNPDLSERGLKYDIKRIVFREKKLLELKQIQTKLTAQNVAYFTLNELNTVLTELEDPKGGLEERLLNRLFRYINFIIDAQRNNTALLVWRTAAILLSWCLKFDIGGDKTEQGRQFKIKYKHLIKFTYNFSDICSDYSMILEANADTLSAITKQKKYFEQFFQKCSEISWCYPAADLTENVTKQFDFEKSKVQRTILYRDCLAPPPPKYYHQLITDLPLTTEEEKLEAIKKVLHDYTWWEEDSCCNGQFARFFHHPRRHHIKVVQAIINDIENHTTSNCLQAMHQLNAIVLMNTKGSLAKRIRFIQENIMPEIQLFSFVKDNIVPIEEMTIEHNPATILPK